MLAYGLQTHESKALLLNSCWLLITKLKNKLYFEPEICFSQFKFYEFHPYFVKLSIQVLYFIT
jgi:hypothetical protein